MKAPMAGLAIALAACVAEDVGPECVEHYDCTLEPIDSCDCSYERGNVKAVRRADSQFVWGLGCGIICLPVRDPTLQAACVAGECTVVDVTADEELSGCETDEDCVTRRGECCACGPFTYTMESVALRERAVSFYDALACAANVVECLECVEPPELPPARCVGGRCELVHEL